MTDFEKLLVANTFIKILKQNEEKLLNENSNLKKELNIFKEKDKNWRKGELREVKKNEFIQKLELKICKLNQDNLKLYNDNQDLITKIHQK